MKTGKTKSIFCSIAALLMTASAFTSCTSDENVADNPSAKTLKITMLGSLGDETTRSCGVTWVDEKGAAGGGLKAQWTTEGNSQPFFAAVFSAKYKGYGAFLPIKNGEAYEVFNSVAIKIDENNPASATLTPQSNFVSNDWDEKDVVVCFTADTWDYEDNDEAVTTIKAVLPLTNEFIQEEANSTKGIRDYLSIWAQAPLPEQTGTDESDLKMKFTYIPATMRYVLHNKRGEAVVVDRIDMVFDEKVIPEDAWMEFSSDDNQNFSASLKTDPETMRNDVYISFNPNKDINKAGLSVGTKNPLLAYAVVIPTGEKITCNATFRITDINGRVYTTDVIKPETLLAQVTGESKFLSGYVYTVNLLLDDKLTLGDISVTPWGNVDGGSFELSELNELSLVDLCKDNSYKAYRESLTSVSLDGSSLTQADVTQYMQGNLATYFPKVKELTITGTTLAANNLLKGNETVTSVKCPDLTSLPESAFEESKVLKSVDLPKVESVGKAAFKECAALTSLSISKVTTLGDNAFYNCAAISSVDLPKVESVGKAAFKNCAALTSLSIPKVTTLGDDAFSSCSNLESISLPLLKAMPASAFAWCSKLSSVDLPEVESVGYSAFSYCPSLSSISLPKATSIGNYAFDNYKNSTTGLTSVNLPEVKTVGQFAFAHQTLETISLPKAESLDKGALEYCNSLSEIYLPEAITIGYYAFGECPKLTVVSLPKAVVEIKVANLFYNTTTQNITLTVKKGSTWQEGVTWKQVIEQE